LSHRICIGIPRRPLLAARGFAVPQGPGLHLRTPADVFAPAAAEGVELRIEATEVRVRRPRANKPGRRAFISEKMRQNTKKATVITDDKGRTLGAGAFRPGRQHDRTERHRRKRTALARVTYAASCILSYSKYTSCVVL
jgi:hypothetical protein